MEIIHKALSKLSKVEGAGSAALPGAAAAAAGRGGAAQPRKTMRRGFFMTLLQQKATQVSFTARSHGFGVDCRHASQLTWN